MRLPSGDQRACHAFTAIVEATAPLASRTTSAIPGRSGDCWRTASNLVPSGDHSMPPYIRMRHPRFGARRTAPGASTCRVPSRPTRTTLPLSSTESSCGSADCRGAAPTRAGFDRKAAPFSGPTSTDERVQPERSEQRRENSGDVAPSPPTRPAPRLLDQRFRVERAHIVEPGWTRRQRDAHVCALVTMKLL